MKSRFVTISLTALVMLALVAMGFGSATASNPLQGATPAATAAAGDVKLPAIAKQIKIAVVLPSAKNDLAWSQSMWDALVKVQTEAGGKDKIDIVASENLANPVDGTAAVRDYVSQGYNVIIAHGTQYGATMLDIAKQFPEVTFIWNAGKAVDLKNVFVYEARAEEGGYVNGVMAAYLSKSGVLGVVGPIEAGDAKLYIDGFKAGALSTGKVKAENIKVAFTGGFGETAKAAETAKTMISQGADVLTGSAQQVPGAITEAQKAKALWLGNQSDQAPKWPDTVAAAQVFDWSNTLKTIIGAYVNKTPGGTLTVISLKDGGLKIVFNDKVKISDEAKKAGADAMKAIIDGKVVVPGNPAAATPAPTAAATK